MLKGGWARRLSCLALAFVLALPAYAADSGNNNEKALKEAQLKKLQGTIGALRQELDKVRGRYDGLREELAGTERAISNIARQLDDTRGQLAARNRRLHKLNRQRKDLVASVATQRAHLADQIRAAYAAGRQEYLKLLLNQQDPATVGRVLVYYDYLNRARSARIGELKTSLAKLDQVTAQINEERRQLSALEDQQSTEQDQLQSHYKDRAKVLAALKRELTSKSSRLKHMVADEKELQRLIQALSEALADIPAGVPGDDKPFATQRGELSWPARGPLLVRYGQRRPLGGSHWRGVIIGAKEGQKVRAVAHGRVAFADWLRGYGMLIIIDHGDGYMSLYGHNQSLFKEAGDWVDRNEVIATVGSSGGQDRTGLYFEIRHNGKPTNPQRWLARR